MCVERLAKVNDAFPPLCTGKTALIELRSTMLRGTSFAREFSAWVSFHQCHSIGVGKYIIELALLLGSQLLGTDHSTLKKDFRTFHRRFNVAHSYGQLRACMVLMNFMPELIPWRVTNSLVNALSGQRMAAVPTKSIRCALWRLTSRTKRLHAKDFMSTDIEKTLTMIGLTWSLLHFLSAQDECAETEELSRH